MITGGTFKSISLLEAGTEPLSEMAISQVPQQHVPAGKVAFAQGTALSVLIRGLKLLKDGGVIAVGSSSPLI